MEFRLEAEELYTKWIEKVILSEGYKAGEINYVFCSDDYLLELHRKHLNKDTYTDIITFDYSEGKVLSGDIFISVERVRENSKLFNTDEADELLRVMAHGVLHMCGFNDKEAEDAAVMRTKETEKMNMFHVEQ